MKPFPLLLFAIVISVAVPIPSMPQPPQQHHQTSASSFSLSELAFVYADRPTAINDIVRLDAQRFKKVTESPFNGGIARGYYWFKFSIANNRPADNIAYINVQNPRINELALYEVNGDSSSILGKYGDFFEFARRKYAYKNFVFSSNIPAGKTKTFYLFVNQVGHSFYLPVKVSDLKGIQGKVLRDYLLEGIVLGVFSYIIILSLFYWSTRKENVYLVYGLYILSAIGWIISYFGLGFQLLWPRYPWINTAAAPLFSCLHMMLLIQLCQVIVHTRKLNATLNRLCNANKCLLLAVGIFPVFLNLDHYGYTVNHSYLVTFLALMMISIALIIANVAFSIKSKRTATFYLYASILKISGILNLALMELGITPAIFRLEQIMVGGLLIEILLLSYGLARRSQLQKIYLRKQKQAMFEQQISLHQEIAKTQSEIQEQTFKKISQEIHDNVGQLLTLLKLNLESLRNKVTGNGSTIIDDAQELLRTIIQDLRNLSKTLSSDMLARIGLAGAMQLELDAVARATSLHVSLDWEDSLPRLEEHVELILFRVMQEAIHNILKHAHASTITVSAKLEPDMLVINVDDDGKGFDIVQKKGSGNGLINLDSRCKLINACFDISSSEKGTNVRICYPVVAPASTHTDAHSMHFNSSMADHSQQ